MTIVAPYVGAWIETPLRQLPISLVLSHPMWVRGLKLAVLDSICKTIKSHPMWVRGLKLVSEKRKSIQRGRTLCGCVD